MVARLMQHRGGRRVGVRRAGLVPVLLAVLTVAAACSKNTTTATGASSSPKTTVTVGATSFDENQIVANMYAEVLSHAGYQVKSPITVVGSREVLQPAMPGQIQVAPEYVGSLLAFLNGTVSSDPNAEATSDSAALASKGLTMLTPSAADDTNAFVVTQATANKYHLTTISSLKSVAGSLTLGGPAECPQRTFCLLGLQQTYGFTMKFQPIGSCDTPTAQALVAGSIDVAVLCSTQAEISADHLVALTDDKHLQQADNLTPEVSSALLTSNPDVKTLLNSVSAKLTTANIIDLNAQVSIDHKSPADVAKTFLTQQGLL
jgi:osmoprotectant transport system substrate-binding protein